MFRPDREAMPLADLRALQLAQLQAMVARQFEHVPAYRAKFEAAGVTPDDLRTLDDLARFPLTRKSDLRDNYPLGLTAVPREGLRRLHASSGTTGKPTVVAYDENDLGVFAEVVARSLYAAGARPGMTFHNAYGYGLFTGGLGLHGGAERLGLNTVPVSGGGTERQVGLILDLEPEVIACTPSYALVLADAFARQGVRPEDLSLRYAVLGAEPWTEKTRREVEARLGVTATNIYGLSEIIGPGVSNEDAAEQRGSYLWEDHFYPEIVDPETGEVLPDGEYGVLVLSSMTRTAMPVLRYWTGDITRLIAEPNSTGRTFRRMDQIRGRADDLIILRGVNVYPTQLEAVLVGMGQVSPHYHIVLTRTGTRDDLTLRVESEDRAPALRAEIERLIKAQVGVTVACDLCEPGSLPRSEGGKLKRVTDLREEG
ncbi:phenylacetate--CoA ligase (plasmid) [Deinococcus metallilatus]|uniref:Phenylacetate-coenzyme A ligase n=1 Tax=Deinococcus metallilatus TaxID=1211322 RepID=A0AAJ5JZS0_9DEIO|nr:phenylacetate--CoA ligase PaaK [Deinococcus metallilatus]MBB5293225.1 phenylacetate-CoA ligase [Deinococcus metallilatus]QBY07012.1 phenylacetate--CoA ligase [Deinococcus metallilatus]RXJ18023.1 phenylacetate--CoA ligase [Deinococcus metallilatus]TLK31959.1 phenylacetate--CoA ligase [Deinococcus metallilatus]GMA15552.1 phenylacetate-coenzyme A ligase [Deinococcus metallilatus]